MKETYHAHQDGATILLRIGKNVERCYGSFQYPSTRLDDTYQLLSRTGYITINEPKNHVWDVALTESGKKAISGDPYGHEQKGTCDTWQVTIPLSTFVEAKVTGIVEDGARAKADVALLWRATPVGLAVKREAKILGLNDSSAEFVLGQDMFLMPEDFSSYATYTTVQYMRYDDGWR